MLNINSFLTEHLKYINQVNYHLKSNIKNEPNIVTSLKHGLTKNGLNEFL